MPQEQKNRCPLGHDFDPLGDHLDDPHAILREARANQSVFYSEKLAAWVLTRYEHIKFACANPAIFSSGETLHPVSPFDGGLFPILASGIADAFLELLTSLKKKYSVFLIQIRVPSHVALERVFSRDQTHQIQLEKEVIAHMNEQSLQMKLEYDLILENEQATDGQLIQQLNTLWTPSR